MGVSKNCILTKKLLISRHVCDAFTREKFIERGKQIERVEEMRKDRMVEEDYFYKNVATCKRQAEKEKRFMRATSTSIGAWEADVPFIRLVQ